MRVFLCSLLGVSVSVIGAVLPDAALAKATGPIHPRRLAGDPIGECFAATLDVRDPGLHVPGTLRPKGWPGYDDSLPPWLCRRPLTDFRARIPRLTDLVRAGMSLDRALVELEACYRSGRQAILDAGLAAGDPRRCLTVVPLPAHLAAAADSLDAAIGLFEAARSFDDAEPSVSALIESVHMETLVLLDLLRRWVPSRLGPHGPYARDFVVPTTGGGALSPPDADFLNSLWEVRWNLDSWLSPLVLVTDE